MANNSRSPELLYIPRVFVAAEADDTHTYHIRMEIMPRIIPHLEFLVANPDIKILVIIYSIVRIQLKFHYYLVVYVAFLYL